jgi:drug/metabolite transporter (DMT)-like permease
VSGTLKHVRNVAIVFALAAIVAIVPGGGTGADVVLQAVSVIFLAALVWVAAIYYRENRVTLMSLGNARRAVLYGAIAVLAVTLTATNRLWQTSAGSVAWLVLMGAALYAGGAVLWSMRRY